MQATFVTYNKNGRYIGRSSIGFDSLATAEEWNKRNPESPTWQVEFETITIYTMAEVKAIWPR